MRDNKTASLLYDRVIVVKSELELASRRMISLLFSFQDIPFSFNESIASKWLGKTVTRIQKILSDSSQPLELSSTTEDSKNLLLYKNFKIYDLGDDLLISILEFLGFKDRIRISRTSNAWNRLTQNSRIHETIFPFTSVGFSLGNPFCLLIYNFRSDCQLALTNKKPTYVDIKNLKNSYVLYKNQATEAEQLFYVEDNKITTLNISTEQFDGFKNELKTDELKVEESRRLFPYELEFISSTVGTAHSNIFPTIESLRRKLALEVSTNFDELQKHLGNTDLALLLPPVIKRLIPTVLLQLGMDSLYFYLPLDSFKIFIKIILLLSMAWTLKPMASAANKNKYSRRILGKLERMTHFYFEGCPIRNLENNIKNYAQNLKGAGEFSFWKDNFKKYTKISVNSEKNLKSI